VGETRGRLLQKYTRGGAAVRPTEGEAPSGVLRQCVRGEVRSHSAPSSKNKEEWRRPVPTDPIFPKWQRELFNAILQEEGLRFDRDGHPRTAYSLRHTYICLRLLEGADIYQIAKNCRTNVIFKSIAR
jgi:integrase